MKNIPPTITIESSEYTALKTRLAELEAQVKFYQCQLLSARRGLYGTSSEQTNIDPRQMNLLPYEKAAPAPEIEEIHYKRKKHSGKREQDLAGLPVERIDYQIDEKERGCPACGEIMRDVGAQTRRELKLIPAKVVVVEHAVHSYACRNCEKNGERTPFAKAKGSTPLISGSVASPSLVAHIAVQKYVSGMPLYRIENGFRYDGVNISRQTMSNWVIQCSQRYLEGIYERLKEYLLKENCLHADETTVQVLREPGRPAQRKSYEWMYRTSGHSGRKVVIYEYQESRGREHPKSFLEGWTGYLHTDGYQAYHKLPEGITVIGCWAHVRRRFENVLKTTPKAQQKGSNGERGVGYINALFSLERQFSDLTPQERYQRRLEESKPISDAFFAWVVSLNALPKSPLGEAAGYALSQRKYLENVYLDGRTEISNNRGERSIKPFVIGRKAWLFANTQAGAQASSVLYSIVETAKENGLHPYRYMEYLLATLPDVNVSALDALLPWSDELPESCYAPIHDGSGK